MYFVFGLLVIVAVLFMLDLFRPDVIALSALGMLYISGILTLEETLSPFSSPVVLMIAALFVISEALSKVGLSNYMGNLISTRVKEGERNKLIRIVMVMVATLGSVMSSTGVVALFVPIVQRITKTLGMNPSRVYMPVAYAGLISGMMTLIAAAPNLIVNEELIKQKQVAFEFLSFTPVGIVALIVAILYFRFQGLFFPIQRGSDTVEVQEELRKLFDKYKLPFKIFRFELNPDSPLVDMKLGDSGIRKRYGINMIGREEQRHGRIKFRLLDGSSELHTGETYYAYATPVEIAHFVDEMDLRRRMLTNRHRTYLSDAIGFAEVIIPYDSPFVGRPLEQISREDLNNVTILASKKIQGESDETLGEHIFTGGETLLVWGRYRNLRSLQRSSKWLISLNQFGMEETTELNRNAYNALTVIALMIGALISGIVPPVVAILGAALLMVLTRSISMEEAYLAVSWRTVILIAAMLPFSVALDKTGGLMVIADQLASWFLDLDHRYLLIAFFVISAALGMFISNAATAVIVAPIAITTSLEMGISPLPVAMTVAIACSAAFLTPLSSPVNMLVAAPGNYRLKDFLFTGLPLLVLIGTVSVGLIPFLFPF